MKNVIFQGGEKVGGLAFLALAGLLSFQVMAADPLKGVSDPTYVDTMAVAKRTVTSTTVPVAYSPLYSGATVAGSYVVLRKVVGYDTQWAKTNVVAECQAGAAGVFPFEFGEADGRNVRLIHTTHGSDGKPIGDEFTADLGCAYAGDSGQIVIDSRTNSLQIAAEKGAPVSFAYSSDWVEGVEPTSVEIKRIHETGVGKPFYSVETSVVFSAEAPATGLSEQMLERGGGLYKYLFTTYDADGEPIGEPYSASYWFKERFGLAIFLK